MNIRYYFLFVLLIFPVSAFSMHIVEGFLPPLWAGFYWILCLPFLAAGLRKIRKLTELHGKVKLLLAMAGAFAFILSALKLPSLTGSSSHPTGVGLGTILFGPLVMSVLGFIVLLFQALLLAHGGLTNSGKTVIISTHDPDFAWRWAGNIILFRDGRVIGTGSPKEIFHNRKILNEAGIDQPGVIKMASALGLQGVIPGTIDELAEKIVEKEKIII